MGIKVIIANDSDILLNSLSDIALKSEEKVEIINVPTNKLESLICQIRTKENLIILDSITSATFCINVLKNAINRVSKINIIILVIDSNSIPNIITREKPHSFFRKKHSDFSLLDIITLVSDSLKETLEIEKDIDTILWRIGITSYFKGSTYLKDAISFAYTDRKLLLDAQALVKKVAEKNDISNYNLVRSDMDKVLNNALDLIDVSVIYDIFEDEYDGRKISLRYFVDLCVRYLEKKRYCCFN